MEVTLIRHTAVDVPLGVCYGQTDVPLKESFEQEALVVAENLRKQIMAEGVFDEVYTSPLSRCTRLAVACGYADALRDDRLKELHFGEWEMQRFDAIRDPRIHEWFNDYYNVATTGGESFMMQYERVAAFLDEVKQQSCERVAVFSHGGVLVCAQIYAGVVEREQAFEALTSYGGMVRITID
ncbi:alpha-ribazole phosphatase [Bacteroides sp.]|uniref:alpha-ribazole phosphatase n=1 Tax=Bacteroides sp. TaxID=29523 RepID=UPI001B5549DF|nr:alpha-ribazole phosphatase [Bacteroides sp.]MBP6936631.1 alpha-ribazole phosphatase [Bacteroides sp.]MBP8621987.1 alpha-ribazole phosphatase [Bacteroides sp.]MBP9585501.1 alpha-ribazole phosphatase [Bacteroides sp.]